MLVAVHLAILFIAQAPESGLLRLESAGTAWFDLLRAVPADE
jgi:hypothetical protein